MKRAVKLSPSQKNQLIPARTAISFLKSPTIQAQLMIRFQNSLLKQHCRIPSSFWTHSTDYFQDILLSSKAELKSVEEDENDPDRKYDKLE